MARIKFTLPTESGITNISFQCNKPIWNTMSVRHRGTNMSKTDEMWDPARSRPTALKEDTWMHMPNSQNEHHKEYNNLSNHMDVRLI